MPKLGHDFHNVFVSKFTLIGTQLSELSVQHSPKVTSSNLNHK